jgi:hypothetical protein
MSPIASLFRTRRFTEAIIPDLFVATSYEVADEDASASVGA